MGSVCLAKVDGGRESAFANLAIREVRREIVGDLDYDSLLKMGYPDLESFINGYQEKGFPLSERDVVHLVEFDVLGRI